MRAYVYFLIYILFSLNLNAQHNGLDDDVWKQSKIFSFIENNGQIKDQNGLSRDDVLYSYQANGIVLHLKKDGWHYQILDKKKNNNSYGLKGHQVGLNGNDTLSIYRVDVDLIGSNLNTIIDAEDPLKELYHFYNVPNEKEPALNTKSYKTIVYNDVYDGVDIRFYIKKDGQLKYDFLIHPHANYKQIKMNIQGAELYSKNNILFIKTPFGVIEEGELKVFQENKEIDANWLVSSQDVSFQIDSYDPQKSIVIDPPVRLWGTYFSQSTAFTTSSVMDDYDNIYITGHVSSGASIATTGAHQMTHGSGPNDSYLSKFDSNGNLIWSTYYGGDSDEQSDGDCIVDSSNNVYLIGSTYSQNNISTTGTHQLNNNGGFDAFLVKFDSSGVRQWGTYFGGSGSDFGHSGAVDGLGNIYLTGYTNSTNNISTVGTHQTSFGGYNDAYLAKFNNNGNLIWGTYYGGIDNDYSNACTVDSNYDVYIAGSTNSTSSISTNGAHQIVYGGGDQDAFLSKFDSSGAQVWGTYFGGNSNYDVIVNCIVYGDELYIVGYTGSTSNISTPNVYQPVYNGGLYDAFLSKFNTNGVQIWGTYFGGPHGDFGYDCKLDSDGNIYFSGDTYSSQNIATQGAHQNSIGGVTDAFLAKFSDSSTLEWGTYYGGDMIEYGWTCEVDANDYAYLIGTTQSFNNIASSSVHQEQMGGSWNGFLAKFSDSGMSQIKDNRHTKKLIEIYPNPSNDVLIISSNEINLEGVSLYSITGQLVFNGEVDGKEFVIDVKHFNPGIYIAEVFTSNENVERIRVVIN